MSEILLRGKRKDNGKWLKGHTVVSFDNGGKYMVNSGTPVGFKADESGNIISLVGLHHEVIPETVGLYTGCCDKSKTTKVFEGDIVWDEIDERYGVVEFDEGEFIVNFNGNVDADRFANVINCCYVCGNIHDNPKLMKAVNMMDKTTEFIIEAVSKIGNMSFDDAKTLVESSWFPEVYDKCKDHVQHYNAEYWAECILGLRE